MAPRTALALVSCALAGCASTAIPEDARPLAEAALTNVASLDNYLETTGVRVTFANTRTPPPQPMPRVTQVTQIRFDLGGECAVVTYETADAAEQLGPREGGGEAYLRRTRSIFSGEFIAIRTRFKPTFRFGPHVAVCANEPPRVHDALLKLERFAREQA